MENNQDSIIVTYLTNLIEDLERKLDYPKNTWKRKEQLQAEISEAKQRLNAVTGRNRRSHSRDSTSSNRISQRHSSPRRNNTSQTPSRPLPQLLEVNYR